MRLGPHHPRGQHGAVAAEFVAGMLIVAALVAALVAMALPERVDDTAEVAVSCMFTRDTGCDLPSTDPGDRPGSSPAPREPEPASPSPSTEPQPEPTTEPEAPPVVEPRETGFTDLVDELTADGDELSTEDYQELSADYVRAMLPEDDPENIYARNAAITRAYAELYFSDPATYKWAGMAAFASELVGEGIGQAERGRTAGLPLIPGVADFTFTDLSLSLQYGNALVFSDIHWQHLAYAHGGLDAIEQAHADGELSTTVLQSWRDIDEGRRSNDDDLVWAGNEGLLLHEQSVTLQQGVYDHDRRMYEQLSSEILGLVAPLGSPIPGDDTDFQDFHSHGDIGDFDDRWAWITDSMLPAWRDGEAELTDELVELLG